MKLTVLKVLSLLVFLGGILVLGLITEGGNETGFFTGHYEGALAALRTGGGEGEAGSLKAFGIVAGLLLTVAGLYGFVPKLPARRDSFTYQGPAGTVTLPLDSIERSLQKIVGKMAEVKKARVQLKAEASGKQVEIRVQAILTKPEGMSARATIDRIHTMIHRTAKEYLGLEELGPIAFNVSFALNPKASEQGMRRDVEAAEARGESLLVAPGVAAAIAEYEVAEAEVEEYEEEIAEAEAVAEESTVEEVEEVDVDDTADVDPTFDSDNETTEFQSEDDGDSEEEALVSVEEESAEPVAEESYRPDPPLAAYVGDELETSLDEEPDAEDLTRGEDESAADAEDAPADEAAPEEEEPTPEEGGLGSFAEAVEEEVVGEESALPEIPEMLDEPEAAQDSGEDGTSEEEEPLPPYNP